MSNVDRLSIRKVKHGQWIVCLDGEPISDPHSKEKANELKEKWLFWYPGKVLDLMHSPGGRRRRGGPYIYELPIGEWPIESTGEINIWSTTEARRILCNWLGRKRLPKGTKVYRK